MANHMFQGPDYSPQCSEADKQAFRTGRPVLNSFQLWATTHAAAFGFHVEPCGNWVRLIKGDSEQTCMSVKGVHTVCLASVDFVQPKGNGKLPYIEEA